MISATPLSRAPRLLDQLREVLRYKHYSLRTEQACLYWMRLFVHRRGWCRQMRHPTRAQPRCASFLTTLATERKVPAPTPNRPRRIPAVLTQAEVSAVLGLMASTVDSVTPPARWKPA